MFNILKGLTSMTLQSENPLYTFVDGRKVRVFFIPHLHISTETASEVKKEVNREGRGTYDDDRDFCRVGQC